MEIEDREARYAGAKKETDDDLETVIERWEQKIGLRVDPEEQALEALKAFNKARGIPWDDTPVVPSDWRERDEEIPGEYMGSPRMKAKGNEI
jgi:hypothetical protein